MFGEASPRKEMNIQLLEIVSCTNYLEILKNGWDNLACAFFKICSLHNTCLFIYKYLFLMSIFKVLGIKY